MIADSAAPVRLAILGAGTIGAIHGLCTLQAPEAQVTAVWSRTPERAQLLAEHFGAVACASIAEAVARPDVDAVMVCTPTFLHREHALAAIAAGKHVLCEKPLARTLDDAHELVNAARAAGVGLYVLHVVRFSPEFRRLHDLIADGAIGRPALVRMSRAASFPRGSGDWHNDLDASGGVVLDMGIHDLDWLLWTLGPAIRVYASGLLNQARPFLDYGLLTVRLASGAMAHIESSWAEAEGFCVHGEISGDGGMLSYDSRDSTALQIIHPEASGVAPPGVNVPTAYTAESPYVSQLRHVCRCIRDEEEPLVPAEQAVEALRLALAALESMATGEVVTL